jgi:hypothetical protein
MEIYHNINKAYRAIQGTGEEAFAVVETAVNDTPLFNGWRASMYYCIVAYHPEKGNYRRIWNIITEIHV